MFQSLIIYVTDSKKYAISNTHNIYLLSFNYAQKAHQIILSPTANQIPDLVFIPENTNVSDIHQQVLLKPLLS